jgi:hypothetical protein
VFIGHGESDKAEAANPAIRAFDEVWIGGEAARTRYLDAGIDVRPEALRITGRPQVGMLLELAAELADVAEAAARTGQRKSVVYAPTWEGYYAEDGYSSIELMGERVINDLLHRDDVAVTYVPHPALGTLSVAAAETSARIVSRVARAGGHCVVQGSLRERYAALAGADLLITDIGSDLVDFLCLDRPYIVLDPSSGKSSESSFATANPSAGAGRVVALNAVSRIDAIVTQSLGGDQGGNDSAATVRRTLATHYLGDLTVPPLSRFLDEVSSCLAQLHATRPARILPPPMPDSELQDMVAE